MTEEEIRSERERKRKAAFEKALLYISALLGYGFSTYEQLAGDEKAHAEALARLKGSPGMLRSVLSGHELSSERMNEEISRMAKEMSRYAMVVTVGDSRTCERCRRWQGRVVSLDGGDPRFPSLERYMEEAVHPNCRCSLRSVSGPVGNSRIFPRGVCLG